MKKRYMIGMIALLILLTLSGCGKESKPINLPTGTDLALEQVFEAEGKIYYLYSNWELRTRTRDYYLATEDMTDGTAYALNGLCTWHEGSGRLYYTEKHKLYSCDLQGGDKTLVWEWKEGKREDTLRVAACSEDRLLLRGAHGTRNYSLTTSYYTREYFSVDPISGEGEIVIPKSGYYAQPGILCTRGNEVFYLRVADGYYSDSNNVTKIYDTVLVKSLDLVSGESRELGSFAQYDAFGIEGSGCIADDALYFVLDGSEAGHRIFEIPLVGGEITEHDTKYFGNNKENGEWVTPRELTEHNGKIYFRSNLGLFAWNRETGGLTLVDDGYRDASYMLLSDGMYYLYTWKDVHSGKLLPDFVEAGLEGETFLGKVVKVQDGMCLLTVTNEGNSGLEIGEKVFVHDIENGPRYSVGDHLKVRFGGLLLESLPPQIKGAFSVEKVGEEPELPPFETAMKECLKGIDLLADYEGEFVQVGDRVALYARQLETTKKDGSWGSDKIGSLLETYKGELFQEEAPDYRWYADENGEEKDGLPPLKWSIESESDWHSVKGEDDLELLIREQTSGRISLWEFEKFVDARGINAFMGATMFPDVTNYEPYTQEDVVDLIYHGNMPQIVVEPTEAFDTLMLGFKYRGSHDPSLSNYLVHGAHANAFPEYYGGAYVDGENLVILLTDSLSREERELREDQYARELYPRNKPFIISEDRLLFRPENILFADAQFSYRELIVVYSKILDDQKAADAAEEYTIGKCGIDDRNNRVIVYLNEVSDGARRWFAEQVTDAECVEFRESEG